MYKVFKKVSRKAFTITASNVLLRDFRNSYTATFSSKFASIVTLKIQSHVELLLCYRVRIIMSFLIPIWWSYENWRPTLFSTNLYLRNAESKVVQCSSVLDICLFQLAKAQTPLHGHRLRTPATDTTNGRAHNNSTTNLPHRNVRAQHLDMPRCWDVANFFVRWWCSLVVFVAGVRV